MTTTLTVATLVTVAAVELLGITLAIKGVQPIAWLRFTFGPDRSANWAPGELTGELPVVRTPGRHRVESVEARLSNGGARLDDTMRIPPYIDAAEVSFDPTREIDGLQTVDLPDEDVWAEVA